MAMAAPSTIELDPYVVEVLMPDLVGHDRRASAYLIYLVIAASPGGRLAAGYGQLAERAGISRRSAQAAVAHLAKRDLLAIQRRGATEASEYRALTPWRRDRAG
jgi:alkylated DNA nucleotide flippase Atl1